MQPDILNDGISSGKTKQNRPPFMIYSFSEDPGNANALNRLFRSCSVKGAISVAEILWDQGRARTQKQKLIYKYKIMGLNRVASALIEKLQGKLE